jgi:serine/threonine protein phosphatase PrpC
MSTKVDHAALSEQGPVRGKNEDSIGFVIPTDPDVLVQKGYLFVVADGVGGHGAGDVASSTAVRMVLDLYYTGNRRPDKALRHAFHATNLKVFDMGVESNKYRMQTTLSALAIVGNIYYICHIGDSRIYRLRESTQAEQLTTDHSEVAELMKLGIITREKIRTHPRRSFITRAVGNQSVIQPMTRSGEVREGDFFVLCTDGIWEPVLETEIHSIATAMTPTDACKAIVDLGLERKVLDNLSVHVLKVLSVPEGMSRATVTINGGILSRLLGMFLRK